MLWESTRIMEEFFLTAWHNSPWWAKTLYIVALVILTLRAMTYMNGVVRNDEIFKQ